MGRILFFTFFIAFLSSSAQVGPRVWQDHLGLNSCNSVAKLGPKIYASNGNGIIRFDEQEQAPEYITKINGLNDVGVRLLRANPYNNKLLVIYEDCNIDVIDLEGNIINYADFKLKTLSGKKIINEVVFDKQFAYLSCGFGLVVFDTDKLEIKDTYFIGANASNLEVYQTALNDSIIFAATPLGIYKANYKTKILNNFNNWKNDTLTLPKGAYSGVVNVAGNILAAYSPHKEYDTIRLQDTLYRLNGNSWSRYFSMNTQLTANKLGYTSGTLFSLIDQFGLKIIDITDGSLKNYITTFNGNYAIRITDAYYGKDYSGNFSYWCADLNFGLYQTYSFFPYYPQNKLKRNGTDNTLISNIDVFNGTVAVSPSFVQNAGGSSYTEDGLNILKDNEWSYIKQNDLSGKPIKDICYVLIDRKDKTKMWASSWAAGLIEYTNGTITAVYNHSNSAIPEIDINTARTSGLAMDADGNLWISSSDSKNYLSVRKKSNGAIINYEFDVPRFIRKILVDKNNFVWILHERDEGITVFKHDNFANPQYKHLSKDVGSGDLESNAIYSIAEDKDGKIWVGTSQGIRVFYNSSNIFANSNFDSDPIKIVQDGNVELLLGKEIVTSIVIDGANNKWCGTESGGVYCFSPDGLQQLYHFTKDNSPLNSDNVIEMNYNEVTGDIFIGTDLGIQSFRSISIEGDESYSNVFAYPNPVRPNYNGSVLVRGLVDKSIVKITDIGGNLVWETKSAGGQIEWPVATLSGSRVKTGVYIIYASTTDGTLKALTKVLVVN